MRKNEKSIPWSEEDLNIVKENYLQKPIKEILSLLSVTRTAKAVRHKASVFGLSKQVKVENYETIKYLEEDGVTYKLCKACKEYFPCTFDYFFRYKNCVDGLRNVCRVCNGGLFKKDSSFHMWSDSESDLLRSEYSDYTNSELVDLFFPYLKESQLLRKGHSMGLKKSMETIKRSYEYKGAECSERLLKIGMWKGSDNPQFNNQRYGSLNPNYKGGVTSLYEELRRGLTQWKLDSAQKCRYECIFTGERFEHIHHLYSFESIVKDVLDETGFKKGDLSTYSDEELKYMVSLSNEAHYIHPLGACMKESVHTLFHDLYGYGGNTPLQFLDFISKLCSGDFDSWLEEQNIELNINYGFVGYVKKYMHLYEEKEAR